MSADEKDLERAARELDESLHRLQLATEKLKQTSAQLREILTVMSRLNDQFPASREFLELKGVNSITDLDEVGLSELQQYLQTRLAQLTNDPN